MYKYIIKRVLLIIPILFGVTFIIFAIMNITPSNPGRIILGINASQEAVDAMNESLGYNKPFLIRFFEYVKNVVLHFEFGNSYKTGKPVLDSIAVNFACTLKLVVLGNLLYVFLGIPTGVYSAVKQYSLGDNVLRVTAMILSAMPQFWICMLAMLVFCQKLGWFPPFGASSWRNFVLPVCVFGLGSAAGLQRLTRTVMLEAIRQDYVRTVRAKGAPEKDVIWKHVFRNSLLPIIMTIGVGFGQMLGGAVLIETIFAMPGIGTLSLNALNNKDLPLLLGCTLFLATIFCVMVLLVDIVSALVDPRVRAKYT